MRGSIFFQRQLLDSIILFRISGCLKLRNEVVILINKQNKETLQRTKANKQKQPLNSKTINIV